MAEAGKPDRAAAGPDLPGGWHIGLQVTPEGMAEGEEAMVDLIGRQTSYQAAMMATSRVMGMTLADYLR